MNLNKFTIFTSIVFIHQHFTLQQDAECARLKTSSEIWTCKLKTECERLDRVAAVRQEIKCGINSTSSNETKICCLQSTTSVNIKSNFTTTSNSTTEMEEKPEDVKNAAAIVWEKCREYAKARYVNITYQVLITDPILEKQVLDCVQTEPLIVNGKEVKEKEMPHMTLIGYGENIDSATWDCGGSLISDRFVLSAAHCADYIGFRRKIANWVLLGKLSRIYITRKLLNENIYRIAERHIHPEYRKPYENHDIALYELERSVRFSPFVRPICLFTSTEIPTNYVKKSIVAGWGMIGSGEEQSDELLKTTIDFIDPTICAERYKEERKYRNGFDSRTMICSGDLQGSNDTCGGDSGGPLQIAIPAFPCMWQQIGITSLGDQFCGSDIPAVYTKVAHYINWIQRIVWP